MGQIILKNTYPVPFYGWFTPRSPLIIGVQNSPGTADLCAFILLLFLTNWCLFIIIDVLIS